MATKDRDRIPRVPTIRRGDPITARYLNRLALGINQTLPAIDPPRSLKPRSTDEQVNALQNDPGRVFQETARVTSIIRVYQDDDPTSDNWVDVERYDQITFQAGTEVFTLVFNH